MSIAAIIISNGSFLCNDEPLKTAPPPTSSIFTQPNFTVSQQSLEIATLHWPSLQVRATHATNKQKMLKKFKEKRHESRNAI